MDVSLQDLLDAMSEPAALVDDAGAFLYGNSAYAAEIVPPAQRAVGGVGIAFGTQADRARSRTLATLREQPRATADYVLEDLDPPCHARIEAARLKPGVVLLRYRDTTAERRAAEESARVAARFAAVLEASSDAMITIDANGRILAANRSVSTLFGYAPETLVGRNVAMLIAGDDATRHDRYIDGFLATGNSRIIGRERIVQGRRADGDVFPVLLTVREATENGERVFVGLIRDVSDAERVREALDRSAISFELALEAGRLGSFDVDLARQTIRADARFRAVFGFSADTLLRCADLADRLRPCDRERLAAQVCGAHAAAEIDFEAAATRLDGAERAIAIRGKVLQRSDGAHIVGVLGDITERREAELQRLREERDRYVIGEMRHRIKNLFTMVGAILNLSVRGHPEALPFKDAVEHRLTALEAAQARLAASGWRSSQLADIVATELEPFRDRRRDIDVSGCDLTVNGHAAQILAMIVHELTTNAAKHGALSAPNGRVQVGCAREDGTVVLTWREEAGPPVSEPARRGFGTTVLGRMAERFLDAQVEVRFAPTGFVYRIVMPAERVLEKH